MNANEEKKAGTVCLVGAGPGDPGLITVTGLARLRAADVVVFDALANPALLNEAPPHAQRIDVGKRAAEHKLTQDQTNQLLVDKARQGGLVVRLKGGDPYLFGRGAEECAFVARHGIACEVIPGVTAGLAAPAAAGIPVTHRKLASTVTIVTGHEDPTKDESSVDYDGLARLIRRGGTACFYMGVGRLPMIARTLVSFGLDARTPAAVVQWGTLPRQRSARGTLATIQAQVEQDGISSPAIIVVGRVAAIDEPGLDFFTARPLFGQRVLVTRTRHQASVLRAELEQLGAQVIETPTLELVPPADWSAVDRAISRVGQYDWLLLTSTNAVSTLAERLAAMGIDGRALAGVRLAAVGDATAESLREHLRLNADFVPQRFTGDALMDELLAAHDMTDKRCLLLRADIARPVIPQRLRAAGAEVDEVVAYHTRVPAKLDPAALDALRRRDIHWVTFTSSSTVRNLLELLGEERSLLLGVKIASIGPLTSATLQESGIHVNVEARRSGVGPLAAALVDFFQQVTPPEPPEPSETSEPPETTEPQGPS